MKLKLFQKQDLARAALKDGLILSWDTGLGKTWALYLWPLIKVGFERVPRDPNQLTGLPERIRPKAPVLIIAPGDLHQQISDEGLTHFGVLTRKLDSQETFMRLSRRPDSMLTNTTPDGRPIVPPAFYITSYTQLTTNGVQKLPDPYDWEPRALLEWFCLKIGEHQPPADLTQHRQAPSFTDVCNFFAWRAHVWRDAYDLFNLDPGDTLIDLDRALQRELSALDTWPDRKQAESQRKKLYAAYEILKNLCCSKSDPRFLDLNRHIGTKTHLSHLLYWQKREEDQENVAT